MGKTALALNIARNAAIDHGKKVAVFSLEMTTRSLVLRLLLAEARVDFSSFRTGYVPTSSDFTRRSQRAANASRAPTSGSTTAARSRSSRSRRSAAGCTPSTASTS